MGLRSNRLTSWALHRFLDTKPRFRRFLSVLLFPNRERDVDLLGLRLRVNEREEHGYVRAARLCRESIVLRDELPVLLNLALLLEPGDTLVDVGANVGLYTAALSRATHLFPGIRFVAFEPHPETFRRLRLTLDGLAAELHNLAVSNCCGVLEFSRGAGSATFGVRKDGHRFRLSGPAMRIAATTLDQAALPGNSLVIKLDVEDHEREVLEGAEGLLAAGRVKAVYVDGYADPALPEWLAARGLQLFDGRSLRPGPSGHSLLAIHPRHLERWRTLR
jgi:FkbM family methyltransferase